MCLSLAILHESVLLMNVSTYSNNSTSMHSTLSYCKPSTQAEYLLQWVIHLILVRTVYGYVHICCQQGYSSTCIWISQVAKKICWNKPEMKILVLCLCVSAHTCKSQIRLHAKVKWGNVQRTKCHEVTELVKRYSPRWSLPWPGFFTTWKSCITHIKVAGWALGRGRGCRQVLKISSVLGFESRTVTTQS